MFLVPSLCQALLWGSHRHTVRCSTFSSETNCGSIALYSLQSTSSGSSSVIFSAPLWEVLRCGSILQMTKLRPRDAK